jgi:hypothetical protein
MSSARKEPAERDFFEDRTSMGGKALKSQREESVPLSVISR